jgi:ribonucleoside-diphosphate reductase alpha chain
MALSVKYSVKLGKQGSTLAGVMDAFSIAVSIGLQYGVPLETFVSKFMNLRFEPAGMTDDSDVRMAQSMLDYIFRRLALDYLPFEDRAAMGLYTSSERARALETGEYTPDVNAINETIAQGVQVESPVAPVAPVTKTVEVKIEAAPAAAQIGSSTELLEQDLRYQIRCSAMYDLRRKDASIWCLLRLRRMRFNFWLQLISNTCSNNKK